MRRTSATKKETKTKTKPIEGNLNLQIKIDDTLLIEAMRRFKESLEALERIINKTKELSQEYFPTKEPNQTLNKK